MKRLILGYIRVSSSPSAMDRSLAAIIRDKMSCDDNFYSFEVSPPKSEDSYCHLLKMISDLQYVSRALFTAISWHLYEDKKLQSLKLASGIQDKNSVLLHLSGAGLDKSLAMSVLQQARQLGVNNIFALRGDRSGSLQVEDDFPYAVDLVTFIREKFGNGITICVAGYPDGHPDAMSLQQDLVHLKQKVAAGADFIITQFCFQADVIINFVRKCREIGISIPIIPGIFPIQDWESLQFMTNLCRVQIPQDVLCILKSIKHNPEAIEEYGVHLAVNTVKKIFASRATCGVHFFTLNRDSTIRKIFRQLGFILTDPPKLLPCDLKYHQIEDKNK